LSKGGNRFKKGIPSAGIGVKIQGLTKGGQKRSAATKKPKSIPIPGWKNATTPTMVWSFHSYRRKLSLSMGRQGFGSFSGLGGGGGKEKGADQSDTCSDVN